MPLSVFEPLRATLFVSLKYHTKGVGRKLPDLFLVWLQANRVQEITLTTYPNLPAVELYQRLK